MIADLRSAQNWASIIDRRSDDVVYRLAADMGGAGYLFTDEQVTAVMHN